MVLGQGITAASGWRPSLPAAWTPGPLALSPVAGYPCLTFPISPWRPRSCLFYVTSEEFEFFPYVMALLLLPQEGTQASAVKDAGEAPRGSGIPLGEGRWCFAGSSRYPSGGQRQEGGWDLATKEDHQACGSHGEWTASPTEASGAEGPEPRGAALSPGVLAPHGLQKLPDGRC